MTDWEIVKSFENAIDPVAHVAILAQCSCRTEQEIRAVLRASGIEPPTQRRPAGIVMVKCRDLPGWTPEDAQTLAGLVEKGLSCTEIAQKMGKSESCIRAHCRKQGLLFHHGHITREQLAQAAAEGLTPRRTAEVLGVALSTVYVAAQKFDIAFSGRRANAREEP